MAVSGPLARSADDLAVALEVLAGAAGPEAQGWRLELPAPPKRALKDYKVAVMLTSPCCTQDDELTDQLQCAVDGLARAGVRVDDTARPAIDLQRAHHLFLLLLRAATGTGSPTTSSPGISPARDSMGRRIAATGPLSTAG
jgi:amidase